MKLYIKNMVSIPCIMVVEDELKRLQVSFNEVKLGYVDLNEELDEDRKDQLIRFLTRCGLELIDDKKSILIENIKKRLIELIYQEDERIMLNYSSWLSAQLLHDYTYMANLFSQVTSVSIENYIISLKIERAKDLLTIDELTLTEVSYKLNYCSVAHLSYQFKKVTGLTPTEYKNIQRLKKLSLT